MKNCVAVGHAPAAGGRATNEAHPITHHLQQFLRVLHGSLTVGDAEFLVQIADMRLDGG